MNKILIILCLFGISCTNDVRQAEGANGSKNEQHDSVAPANSTTSLQLNNGAKWKTDEATRKNVAALLEIINDSTNIGMESRVQLTKQLQTRIDILVQQCKLKGPDHDALHLWLEQVLNDLRELKKDSNEYQKAYTTLKEDVERFHYLFE